MPFKKTRKVYKRRAAPRRKMRMYRTPGEANMKHFDTTSMSQPVASNATTQFEMAPFGLSEGTDFNQRLGRKIRIYKVEMWCNCVPNPGFVNPQGDSVRCIVVLDSEVRGVTFTGGDIMDSASSLTFYNASKVPSRFKVIDDMARPIVPTSIAAGVTTSTASVPVWKMTYSVPFTINYVSNFGTLVDIQDFSIRATAIATTSASNPSSNMQMNARYWFKDIQ